jgi:hypothetical protein
MQPNHAAALLVFAAASCASGATLFTTLLETGEAAPGIPNTTIAGLSAPVINDAGIISLRAAIAGAGGNSGNDQVIFSGSPGALIPIAREGGPAFGGSAAFGVLDPRLILTDTGETLFFGTLTGAGISAGNDRFLGHALPGSAPFKIAQEGDPIPGTSLSIAANGLEVPTGGPDFFAQDDGRVAFGAKVVDSGAPGVTQDAVLIFDPDGGLRVVVKTGDAAPGGLGTFAPTGISGPPLDLVGLGPDGQLIIEGSGTDGVDSFNGIFDVFGGGPLVPRHLAGDPLGGVKKNRGPADFNHVVASDGGLIAFDSTLLNRQTGEVLFNELALATDQGPGSVPRAAAVRDKPAPGAGQGVVYSGFSGSLISEAGVLIFDATLFKKPNGLEPPKDTGVFTITRGKDEALAIGGSKLKVDLAEFSDAVVFAQNLARFGGGIPLELQAVLLAHVFELDDPGQVLKDAIVSADASGKKPINTVIAMEGEKFQATGGTRTVEALPLPTAPMGSTGQARSTNQAGETAVLVNLSGGGQGAYVFPSPRPPGPVRQPDIILEDAGKFGDDVHQNEAATVQLQSRDVPVNMVEDFVFYIQNDGNVTDTIKFTSSGKDARDRLRWFLGDDNTTEISDDVFGEGRSFTLDPGARQKVRLVVQRQTLENKGKTDKVKMKAVSTSDKKKRDNFQLTVVFKPI